MIPTSAHTGDGMGSLIAMIIEKCQTTLAKRLSYTDELQATVMEVRYDCLEIEHCSSDEHLFVFRSRLLVVLEQQSMLCW